MSIQVPASLISRLLARMLRQALNACHAGKALRRVLKKDGDVLTIGSRRYALHDYERVVVVGAGKATAMMARAIEPLLGRRLDSGIVIVKYGHAVPTRRITVKEAGHPIPDRAGLAATKRLLGITSSLTERDLLIVLLSGGASSLMPAPVRGVTLADKRRVTGQLLRCGASIGEINAVRKHLSDIKGGRLAASTRATIVTLILSDVLGDDLSAIASGPTAPDPTTYADAIDCLTRYRLWSSAPHSVRMHLEQGRRGHHAETPKPGAPLFRKTHHAIIGNNEMALTALTSAAGSVGLRTILHPALTGEARVAGSYVGSIAQGILTKKEPILKPCCLVAGGETTVVVRGRGRGGRAQEFAVAAAQTIAGLPKVWVAALGTDGTDGPTDVAGALVNGDTWRRARRVGVDLSMALKKNDTYPALKRLRSHITTGPTGTNVNDLYLLFVL